MEPGRKTRSTKITQNSKLKTENYNVKFKYELGDRIYRLVLELIQFLDGLRTDNTSRTIRDQLLRSGASIGANYMEAQAASSNNESRFWLTLLRDSGRAGEGAEVLLKELSEIANILASSILTMKGKR